MSALLRDEIRLSDHYWMLWIAPNQIEITKIRNLPSDQQQRVLMLHPRNVTQLCEALKTAITSGLYHSITLDKALIPSSQQSLLEIMAIKYQTHINWLKRYQPLNSANQLSLI